MTPCRRGSLSIEGREVGHGGGLGLVVGVGWPCAVVGWFCLVFEDGVEWWLGAGGGGELSCVVVGCDVDLVEEGLVEQAADVVGCLLVGVGGVLGQVEGLGDELLLGVQVLVQGGLPALDGGQLAGDAGLLGLESLQGDGVGVVGLEEFFALALQSAAVGRQVVQFLGGLLGQFRQLGVQGLLQLSAGVGVQADALVEAGDFVLDLFGQGGVEGAVGLFLGVAAQADEVFVGHVLGCGVGDDES